MQSFHTSIWQSFILRERHLFIDMGLHSTSVLSRTSNNSEIRYYLYIFICAVFTSRFSCNQTTKIQTTFSRLANLSSYEVGLYISLCFKLWQLGSSLFQSSNS